MNWRSGQGADLVDFSCSEKLLTAPAARTFMKPLFTAKSIPWLSATSIYVFELKRRNISGAATRQQMNWSLSDPKRSTKQSIETDCFVAKACIHEKVYLSSLFAEITWRIVPVRSRSLTSLLFSPSLAPSFSSCFAAQNCARSRYIICEVPAKTAKPARSEWKVHFDVKQF